MLASGGGASTVRLFIVKYGFGVGCGCRLRGTLRVNERVKIPQHSVQMGRQRRRGNTMAVLHCIHAALMASHTHTRTHLEFGLMR